MSETKQSETPSPITDESIIKWTARLVTAAKPSNEDKEDLAGITRLISNLELENQRLREALEKLRDGDFSGTPINAGCAAMMLIEEALTP